MNAESGKIIIYLGLGITAIGLLIFFFHDKLHWIGRLPGDIRIEKENFNLYFPVTTMLLLSVVISLLLGLIRKLL